MLTTADFRPITVRRRRMASCALGVVVVLLTALFVVHHADQSTSPRLPDLSALQATRIAPRVVVFSVPTRGGGRSSGDGGKSRGGDSGDGQSGGSAVAPPVMDGSGSSSTLTDTNSSGTTTLTHGAGHSHEGGEGGADGDGASDSTHGGSGISGQLPAPTQRPTIPGVAPQPLPEPTSAMPAGGVSPAPGAASVFPPLQNQDGTARTAGIAATPSVTLPRVGSSQSGGGAMSAAAAPATMLVQVQCPGGAGAGMLCFEATTSNGVAAGFPSAASLPSLPVVPSPGSATTGCPGVPTGISSGSPASQDTRGDDSADNQDDGDNKDDGGGSGSGKYSQGHSDGAKEGSDSAALLGTDAAGQVAQSVSGCGLLGEVANPAAAAVGGAVQVAKDVIPGSLSKILRSGSPRQVMLHTTGYSFQDNQGGNNSTISCGTIHKNAGGDGTYNDPITAAVPGHANTQVQIPCGTEFYIPGYKRYIIVEDTGATEYNDADHTDIYVGGEGASASASQKCMDPVTTTDGHPIPAIENPPANEPVNPGPITRRGWPVQRPQWRQFRRRR